MNQDNPPDQVIATGLMTRRHITLGKYLSIIERELSFETVSSSPSGPSSRVNSDGEAPIKLLATGHDPFPQNSRMTRVTEASPSQCGAKQPHS
jgi:hypothetical protein